MAADRRVPNGIATPRRNSASATAVKYTERNGIAAAREGVLDHSPRLQPRNSRSRACAMVARA